MWAMEEGERRGNECKILDSVQVLSSSLHSMQSEFSARNCWWDSLNRPLQVSADCLGFLFSACASHACIPLVTRIHSSIKIHSPNDQRMIKLRQ